MNIHPVTKSRWEDLVQLFQAHGNPNYCWCMTWRMPGRAFRNCSSQNRQKALKQNVQDNIPIGLIGYIQKKPIGWCSIAPRETYARLERSRTIPRIDDKNTWAITCFFISPEYQQKGMSLKLLKEAVNYACSKGAEVVEGYPVKPKEVDGKINYKVSYRFMGYLSTFRKAGFKDMTPQNNQRKIMRYHCTD
ncbi:MAG: GNAT family N-acetyltransferase [Gracilimonas sp.]|nr:GNAT family N-acetyltransferase [Gracilimonas sp.]